MKIPKYRNKKVTVCGETFDSMKEANRWGELKMMQRAGKIAVLERQVKFILIPAQHEPDTVGPRGGVKKGKVIEKECSYVADFVYTDNSTGKKVVEDAKGYRTKDYVIKRKLMLVFYGIQIREV